METGESALDEERPGGFLVGWFSCVPPPPGKVVHPTVEVGRGAVVVVVLGMSLLKINQGKALSESSSSILFSLFTTNWLLVRSQFPVVPSQVKKK